MNKDYLYYKKIQNKIKNKQKMNKIINYFKLIN